MKRVLFYLFASVLLCSIIQAQSIQTVALQFTPEEAESMLFLYNQTQIKGADVEVIAPLGEKLKAGFQQAKAQQDSTKPIKLELTIPEVQVCLGIIQQSTFEAKYASLVYGMKQKLIALLPPELLQPQTDATGGEEK